MDPGPEGKLYADDYGLSIDSYSELDPEEWLHGFQLADDGKQQWVGDLGARNRLWSGMPHLSVNWLTPWLSGWCLTHSLM